MGFGLALMISLPEDSSVVPTVNDCLPLPWLLVPEDWLSVWASLPPVLVPPVLVPPVLVSPVLNRSVFYTLPIRSS